MSDENTSVDTNADDLDAFSAELFGQSSKEAEATTSEAVEDDAVEDDATENTIADDTGADEDENEADEAEEDVEDVVEEPKKPKNRFQERIDNLTAKAREAERDAEALRKRLEALESKETPQKDTKTPIPSEDSGPSVDDKDDDGNEKYPLGEFDPKYIRDLTKFTLQQEREAMKREEAEASQQKAYEAEREALKESWTEKLGPAQERYPDFIDKGEQLFGTFAGIDQTYGEYLTATLMSMDHGPDVLYYLANNLDEANKIVNSGATKATIALGKIEAKFADAEVEKTQARPRVTKAPAPPATLKGSTAVLDVPDDTDDLDAFSRKLFKKK